MIGSDVLAIKAVLKKHKNVRDARTDKLNAKTAFKRDRAVFIFTWTGKEGLNRLLSAKR